MLKVNAETDHGRVVWAKLSKSTRSWPALIISTKILELIFEEKPGKVWVWWIGENQSSILRNNLIFDFCDDFKSHVGKPNDKQISHILDAIEIVAIQFDFELPEELIRSKDLISWAMENLKKLTQNKTGKRKREGTYFIPSYILDEIHNINSKNAKALVKNNVVNEVLKKNQGLNKPNKRSTKRKLRSCFSCHEYVRDISYDHPLFNGIICETCRNNVVNILLPIAKDKSNYGCCICFSNGSSELLVMCDYCIRVYCKKCLIIYCGDNGQNKIIKTEMWKCFACENSTSIPNSIVKRSTNEQLQYIYDLYPGNITCNHNKNKKCSNEPEIQIFALKDIKNNVSTAMKELRHPFKLINSESLDNLTINHDVQESDTAVLSHGPKLVMQYYPNDETYDVVKFNKDETMKTFFHFILEKDRLQLKFPKETIFWAFETSAAIGNEERTSISKYCGVEPVFSIMHSNDVRQRGRFIWTNFTLCDENVAKFKKYNIFLQKMNQNVSLPWCYSSVYIILSSFISHNNIK